MEKPEKILASILRGASDNNVAFSDLRHVLETLGFAERINGDHFIYVRPEVDEIINLQPKGNKAKGYQVKQVRNIILKYKLVKE